MFIYYRSAKEKFEPNQEKGFIMQNKIYSDAFIVKKK